MVNQYAKEFAAMNHKLEIVAVLTIILILINIGFIVYTVKFQKQLTTNENGEEENDSRNSISI